MPTAPESGCGGRRLFDQTDMARVGRKVLPLRNGDVVRITLLEGLSESTTLFDFCVNGIVLFEWLREWHLREKQKQEELVSLRRQDTSLRSVATPAKTQQEGAHPVPMLMPSAKKTMTFAIAWQWRPRQGRKPRSSSDQPAASWLKLRRRFKK